MRATSPPRSCGVDLDGCVYSYDGAFRRWLVERLGWDAARCPDPVRWEFYTDWGMTLEEFLGHQEQAVADGLYASEPPMPGAVDGLRRLREAGWELHVLTARPPSAAESTRAWLAEHGIDVASVTIGADKTAVRCEVFVEDKPSNYAALRAAGVDCWLVARAWNAGSPERADAAARGRLVPGVAEFADAVLALRS